ncbi:alpha/beta hydrolase [Marinitenerispora sediminis]|uniref:Lysophospholipase n=1 Tax=Marinitenerispora sediminis TaxID=1931232 RepID=A0A368T684_9ACTN|nr:alpha/beta hydrolase [Marinitenerispora sediminis]RCV57429.1 lysophospholipase [Marinitenerispora sediminis]RCV58978.1 lysophospholipase [Marinitenerispora sediminis]RCV61270.1 lysophospholipase [Marinitenerispora sediminis]
MVRMREWSLPGGPNGSRRLAARAWAAESGEPGWLAVLVHGYGEHIGRYGHVAEYLCGRGAVVYGLDHQGHGRSDGERVLIEDFTDVVTDVHRLVTQARTAYRTIPLVLVGHSMGGLIAARYAQLHPDGLAGLVLSGPVLGRWRSAEELLSHAEIPDTPIDPATLSRDPAVGESYVADELVWHGPFRRTTLRAITTELARITEAGSLGTLPLLWLHGSDDRLVPLADSAAGVARLAGSDAAARIFPGARHEVFNETDRAEVLAEVVRFAERVTAASGSRPH